MKKTFVLFGLVLLLVAATVIFLTGAESSVHKIPLSTADKYINDYNVAQMAAIPLIIPDYEEFDLKEIQKMKGEKLRIYKGLEDSSQVSVLVSVDKDGNWVDARQKGAPCPPYCW